MGRASVVVLVAAIGCSAPDHAADPLGVAPQTVDEHGVPRLLTSTTFRGERGKPIDVAVSHVTALSRAWGVAPEDLPALAAIGDITVPGGSIVRVVQQLDGLPIDGGELRVMTAPDGGFVAASGTLVGATAPRTARFTLRDDQAIAVAAPGTLERARAKRSWLHHGGELVAGWIVEAYVGDPSSTHSDLIRVLVRGDGRVLSRQSLVADAFGYRVFANPDLSPLDGPIADVSPHPTGVPDGSYPGFVESSLVTVDGLNHPANSTLPDPWLVSGKTETQGNNVEAYVDTNAPSGLTFGDFRATVTATGVFDRAYDPTIGPLQTEAQQMAAVTSLFYVINWLHDFWYDAGFTEAAGNAQDANFGRGGEDRDALLAEAQDNAFGGSRNNANMATPSDGLPPRMQVFLWSGLDEHTLTLQPSGRTPAHGIAGYGIASFDVTAEVVLAVDGAGDDPNDLCEAITNDVTGKIVLVDRGNCTFESKALKIQNAGGVGMIVTNNVDGNVPTLGDDAATTDPIQIAQLSITQAEGAAIKAELLEGAVTATMHRLQGPELDGAVDATLIAHEFGHYLHHRLQQCNSRLCAAISEGWGDFLSLMLMARDGDDLTKAYPIAVYATRTFSDDAEYFGIRRAPYSIDPAINALSFRHMSAGAVLPTTHPFLPFGAANEVHNAGEIWTEVMWEAYVALQQARGTATFEATRNKMAAYVVAGLLMAPVDGTPTETRDAILIAARASSQADHDALAAAFARRGMGSCAVSPERASADFLGIVESSELKANLIAAPTITATEQCDDDDILDAGEHGRVVVALSNTGAKALTGATAQLTTTTAGVTITTAPIALDLDAHGATTLEFELAIDDSITEPLAGAFELAITGGDSCNTIALPLVARINVDDRVSQATTDTFDSEITPWQATFSPSWKHIRESALDGAWHGAPPAVFSDGSLESPLLTGDTGPITLTFEHRYSFEVTADTAFDGGVLEFSIDGSIWQDVTTLDPSLPYGTLALSGVGQPLSGRVGFTGTNPSYPNTDTVTVDLSALANKPFKLRWRIASDNSNASEGWRVDNVALTGLANKPFPAQLPNAVRCDGTMPPTDGGGEPVFAEDGCCGAGGSSSSALFALGVIALILRRKR